MGYTLSWYVPGSVLCVVLEGRLTRDELVAINAEVMAILDEADGRICVLLDMTQFTCSYHTSNEMRLTQSFARHRNISWIVAVTDSKLNRLIALLAFGSSKAKIIPLDSFKLAADFLERYGLSKV